MDHLLPPNATDFEKAMSLSMDRFDQFDEAMLSMHGFKLPGLGRIPRAFLPFMVYEFGLGEISSYFGDPETLIMNGLPWQRQRGTFAAVRRALTWINQAGDIEHFPTRRKRWNLWMEHIANAIPIEEPTLDDIEYLCNVSAPARSFFWRGFRDYDVRALDWSWTKWSQTNYSTYSGARTNGKAKWSFGRSYEFNMPFPQAALEEMGIWIAPTGSSLMWGPYTWANANASWQDPLNASRAQLMISNLVAKKVRVVFRAGEDVIGYRRARIVRGVDYQTPGIYRINDEQYGPSVSPSMFYVEALTDFGNGSGYVADNIQLVFGGTRVNAKVGDHWLDQAQLTGGTRIDIGPVNIDFRRTVRERVKMIFRF